MTSTWHVTQNHFLYMTLTSINKLKCHCDQILEIHFFFVFNLLRSLELGFLEPLFPRIYGPH